MRDAISGPSSLRGRLAPHRQGERLQISGDSQSSSVHGVEANHHELESP